MKQSDSLKNERELIYLLLHNRNAIDAFTDNGLFSKQFHEEYQPIVIAILEAYDLNNVLLTRKSFVNKLKQGKIPKDRIALELAFNACSAAVAKPDDLPLLINNVIEEHLETCIGQSLDEFTKSAREKDKIYAIKKLADDCQDLLDGSRLISRKSYYKDIRELSKKMTKYIKDVMDGVIKEEPLILSGIEEIDYTMVTGFERGTLTLFCADVGGYKSTMMLNIALNVWKFNHNVLFVPLEMTKEQMWRRACGREARVETQSITRDIKNLPLEEFAKIEKMNKVWDQFPALFYMMESPGNTTVGRIQRQIERNIEFVRPKLVVVDYIANLEAERNRYGRNDLEIGDMLKSLRQMGKDLGFATISGAQLGRAALNRIRKAGANRDKTEINSEDIRGSHEYAADADNIYAQLISTSQPTQLLDLFCVKSRQGPTVFANGSIRAILEIHPQFGLIKTLRDYNKEYDEQEDDIMMDYADKVDAAGDIIQKSKTFNESDNIYEYGSDKKTTNDDEWGDW